MNNYDKLSLFLFSIAQVSKTSSKPQQLISNYADSQIKLVNFSRDVDQLNSIMSKISQMNPGFNVEELKSAKPAHVENVKIAREHKQTTIKPKCKSSFSIF